MFYPEEREQCTSACVSLSWGGRGHSFANCLWQDCFMSFVFHSSSTWLVLLYRVLRGTAVQGLWCSTELSLLWKVKFHSAWWILQAKVRYSGSQAESLRGCVKDPEVQRNEIFRGVYCKLLPCFPRKCSWNWVPHLGLLGSPGFVAKCHSSFCAHLCACTLLPGCSLCSSHALPDAQQGSCSEALEEPATKRLPQASTPE